MKITKILLAVAASLLAIAPTHAASTFVHTGNVVPLPEAIRIADGNGLQSPLVMVSAPSITTNLMIDPDSMTARFSGTVGSSTTTLSYTSVTTEQRIGYTTPSFPNPPEPIFASGFATINVTLSFTGGTFDTGVQNIGWNGEVYTIPTTFIATFSGTMAMDFSVTSGGQTNSFTRNMNFNVSLFTFGVLNLDDYPNDASIDTRLYWTGGGTLTTFSESAPNGFGKTLYVNSVVVPEPSSAVLLSAGLVGLAFKRRRA